MDLTHKIFKLVDAKGGEVEISDIANVKVLINDYDFTQFVIPRAEDGIKWIEKAEVDGSSIKGHSIFERFSIKSGYFIYDGIPICLYDDEKKCQLLVAEIKEVPFMHQHLFDVALSDEDALKIIEVIKKCFEASVEEGEEEVSVETTEPPVLDTPVVEPEVVATTQEPVAEVVEPVKEETPVTEEVTATKEEEVAPVVEPTTEPVTETVTETVPEVVATEPVVTEPEVVQEKTEEQKAVEAVSEQNVKQLEENTIPENVMEEYKTKIAGVLEDGFKEYTYKNYRLLLLPETNGNDAFLLLLTTGGVMKVAPIYLYSDDEDEIIKYKFELDGNKKSLYLNKTTGEMVVKRPKKGDANKETVEVK